MTKVTKVTMTRQIGEVSIAVTVEADVDYLGDQWLSTLRRMLERLRWADKFVDVGASSSSPVPATPASGGVI